MGYNWIPVFSGLLLTAFTSTIQFGESASSRKGKSKDDFVQVQVPAYVQEGETAFLRCLYDVDTDKLYSMKWYKGAQEFFRFTPKESPPVKTFPAFGGQVDLSLSNYSNVALVNVDLNMTDKYTCEVTKDFPDYTTSMKAGKMTVVALPHQKPLITVTQRSVSVGDIFNANCTSFRSNPIAKISWMLNGFSVGPHYLSPPITFRDEDNKETITARLNFIVRQQDFIRGRMTLTCQVKIDPDLYSSSIVAIVLEHDRPKISSVVDNYSSLLPSAGGQEESSDSRNMISSSDFSPSRSISVTTATVISLLLPLLPMGTLFVHVFH